MKLVDLSKILYHNPEIIKTMMKYNKGFGVVKVENENE